MKWNRLCTLEQLESLHQASQRQPIVIFKHSTRCSISAFAKKRFEAGWSVEESVAQAWLLDLIAFRELSNAIAARYGVAHESPQVILLSEGRAIYDVSHLDIQPEEIVRQIEAIAPSQSE